MKTESQIRTKLAKYNFLYKRDDSFGDFEDGERLKIINAQIKLLEWILDE